MKLLVTAASMLVAKVVIAQVLTLSGPARVAPGDTASVALTLTGSVGKVIGGLQWTWGGAISSPAVGAVATSATKSMYCSPNNSLCLLIGLNSLNTVTNAVFADGVVATAQVLIPSSSPPGPITIPLSNLFAVSTSGINVAIVSGAPLSISVTSRCDITGDGVVDGSDLTPIINALIGKGVCPLSGGCTLSTLGGILFAATGGTCPL